MASVIRVGEKWRAQVRRKGHAPQCKTFRTKVLADAWAREIEASIDAGQAPAQPGQLLLADLIDEYRNLRDKSRPISDSSNEHYMLRHLKEGLGHLRAGALTPQDLATYCKARKDEGAGPYTCNMEIGRASCRERV